MTLSLKKNAIETIIDAAIETESPIIEVTEEDGKTHLSVSHSVTLDAGANGKLSVADELDRIAERFTRAARQLRLQ